MIYGNPLVRYSLEDIPELSPLRIFRGCVGLWWDPQYGILPLNPLIILAAAGLVWMKRTGPHHGMSIWLSGFVPYFTAVALLAELSGGICPRGRFTVAWVPLLAVPLACALQTLIRQRKQIFVTAAAIPSLIITALLLIRPGWQIVYPGGVDHLLNAISLSLEKDLLSILPGFDRVNARLLTVGTIQAFLLIGIAFAAHLLTQRPRPFKHRWTSPYVAMLFVLLLGTGLFGPGTTWQTPWMHAEDVGFKSQGNVRPFWEETRDWEYPTESFSPYRSGLRTGPGGRIERRLPMRLPLHSGEAPAVLEIDARGSAPDPRIPLFTIAFGPDQIIRQRLRSTHFETYRFPCPEIVGHAFPAPVIKVPELPLGDSGDNGGTGDIRVDIDRMRLIRTPDTPERIQPHPQRWFPVHWDGIKINDVVLSVDTVDQGSDYGLSVTYEMTDSSIAPDLSLLMKQGTRTSFHALDLPRLPGNQTFTQRIAPDPSAGSGVFDLLLLARDRNHPGTFQVPEGVNVYRMGYGAWAGQVQLRPRAVPVASPWDTIQSEFTDMDPHRLTLHPWAYHLTEQTRIDSDVALPVPVERIIVISHLSHVFQEIPFRTRIGEIRLNTPSGHSTKAVILGRDTAEAMYEFGGKNVRLSHGTPPVIRRIPDKVDWPFILADIEYEALYYRSDYVLDTPSLIETISLQSISCPGIWNVYAIVFVSTE